MPLYSGVKLVLLGRCNNNLATTQLNRYRPSILRLCSSRSITCHGQAHTILRYVLGSESRRLTGQNGFGMFTEDNLGNPDKGELPLMLNIFRTFSPLLYSLLAYCTISTDRSRFWGKKNWPETNQEKIDAYDGKKYKKNIGTRKTYSIW